jgi:hypothetical protein
MRNREFSNASGYGFWCGKKCVAKKQAEGLAPKFGKKNKEAYALEQAQIQQRLNEPEPESSTLTIVMMGVGVLAILGIGGYLIFKK